MYSSPVGPVKSSHHNIMTELSNSGHLDKKIDCSSRAILRAKLMVGPHCQHVLVGLNLSQYCVNFSCSMTQSYYRCH
jgi:hypothetical protein